VAVRKLPPSLFSAKARAPQSGCSTLYFHFIASVRQQKNQYALVCESQPLPTSPFWLKGVKYVSETFCKGCLRTVQNNFGGADGIRIHQLYDNKGVLRRTLAF